MISVKSQHIDFSPLYLVPSCLCPFHCCNCTFLHLPVADWSGAVCPSLGGHTVGHPACCLHLPGSGSNFYVLKEMWIWGWHRRDLILPKISLPGGGGGQLKKKAAGIHIPIERIWDTPKLNSKLTTKVLSWPVFWLGIGWWGTRTTYHRVTFRIFAQTLQNWYLVSGGFLLFIFFCLILGPHLVVLRAHFWLCIQVLWYQRSSLG